ncbi:hypothetical protein [Pantoea ananatis]|uniref:hypothetical protein n=1 Tax=Pantoea ananas TaxID=553 RepID=UPI0007DAD91F|nr:hypothetical protein [Pantoea ananatis]MCW0353693.1 hypothetical protein [Pantoea ananatis]USL60472.1 hypothetical protein IAQ00_22695 [Pantoea ananatis]UYL04070.1 hypothetical protein NG830_22320 [Pantoea ananatis]
MSLNNSSLDDYKKICKQFLIEDKPEQIDNVFITLCTLHREYRLYFIKQFTGVVMNHYFLPVLDHKMRSVIFPEWETINPNWTQKLEQALLAKKTGQVARAMRDSLSIFAQSR